MSSASRASRGRLPSSDFESRLFKKNNETNPDLPSREYVCRPCHAPPVPRLSRSLGSAGPLHGGLSDAGRPAAGASLARLGVGRSLREGDPRSSAMRRPSLVSSGGPGTTKGCWVSSLVRSDLRGGRLMFAGRLCWARGHHRLPRAPLQGIVSLTLRRKKQGLGEVAQVPAPQLTSHWRDWRWSSDPSRRLRPELRPCLA